ncbi:hypothetical protein WG922_05020 [Ramlibacter sp. AN1015]|uniref:hypothetical protein n=1 Tax=Ramlibacter sp. AN1015 TaxID=3133428 RepID=UPI0030C27B47
MNRRPACAGLVAGPQGLHGLHAQPSSRPTGPLKIAVAFTPGGSSGVLARAID